MSNLTNKFSYWFNQNRRGSKLDMLEVFDAMDDTHKSIFRNLDEDLRYKFREGLNYYDCKFLDILAWTEQDKSKELKIIDDLLIDRYLLLTSLNKKDYSNYSTKRNNLSDEDKEKILEQGEDLWEGIINFPDFQPR